MKKKIGQILSALAFLVSACVPVTPANITPLSPSQTPTLVPATSTPSTTPIPPVETITPLPTIPTFTPTFDVSTIVTVTSAAPAICSEENPATREFATPDSNGFYEIIVPEDVLTYLNSGGTLAQLEKSPPFSGEIKDLTGDGRSEVVLRGLVRYDILGCKDGKYQNLFQFFTYDFSIDLEDILDLNKDGTPELIFYSFSRYGYANIYIVGWDGNEFQSLIDVGIDPLTGELADYVYATTYHKLIDTNEDGLRELVAVYNVNELCEGMRGLDFCDGTPARYQTTILGWNGQNYVDLKQEDYAPPQYRFQAIQDGDWHTRYGNYARALFLYQEAIFNDELEWWSPERKEYEVHLRVSQYDINPTVYPTPIADVTEYPRLAAYAYYRIMLLHIVQGHESDAGTVYKTLQQKFGDDPYGRPYVEMATTFWDTYQSTHKMYDGCAVAIQYAAEHPEILIPLGSDYLRGDYHGDQSHVYVPEDVCPFR